MAGLGLSIAITGDTKGLTGALKEADSGISVFGKTVSAKGVAGVAALAGGVGIAVAAIAGMTQAAAADRDETNKLAASIAAATGSTADYTAEVEAAIAAGQERAFTDSETRAALEPLVRSTGDVALATSQLALAQDLARAAGVDLATAAEAVAKANQGQDTALARLLPGLEKGATATETLANAQAAAAGQADAFANSTEGSMAKTADAFGEVQEEIGAAFLPVLDAILPALLPILKAFGELVRALLPLLVPLISALGKALGFVADILVRVVKEIVRFITQIKEAIDKVGDFLKQVPLVGDFLGGAGGQAVGFGTLAAGGAGAGTFAAGTQAAGDSAGTSVGNIIINITGDPLSIEREVVRALRTYGRRNGVAIVP